MIALLAQPPRRWQEPLDTLDRTQIHALLGIPDMAWMDKGFDGWDRPAGVGAWVLIIRYDEESRPVSVQRKFDWGLGYLSWDRNYRQMLDIEGHRTSEHKH